MILHLPALNNFSLTHLHTQQGNFNSSVGPDGYMLSAVTCGMSPVTSITEGLQQVKPPLGEGAGGHVCIPKVLFPNLT